MSRYTEYGSLMVVEAVVEEEEEEGGVTLEEEEDGEGGMVEEDCQEEEEEEGGGMRFDFSSCNNRLKFERNSGMEHDLFTNPEEPGYVGFANLPNQVHRKSVKKGFEFTLMVVGESGLGKSTVIDSLFLTDLYARRFIPSVADKVDRTVKIETSTVEIEERGVKLRLTVVDTPGYADAINSNDCFKAIVDYVDAQYDKYLQDESGLNRRGIVDSRVHCCFYFINPIGHGLKPLDVAFMRSLHHKVNIVPVIAKADTLTSMELIRLKKKILDEIEKFGIQIYPVPDCDDDEDEEYREQCKQLKEAVPFAVIGSNTVLEVKSRKVRGRLYPWGVVEVENPDHCDFIKLRTMLIAHMQDLQEVTQEIHYENFRSERIASGGGTVTRKINKSRKNSSDVYEKDEKLTEKEKQLLEKEAELRKMQELISRMQAEMQRSTNTNNTAAQSNPKAASTTSNTRGAPGPPPPRGSEATRPSTAGPAAPGGRAVNGTTGVRPGIYQTHQV